MSMHTRDGLCFSRNNRKVPERQAEKPAQGKSLETQEGI